MFGGSSSSSLIGLAVAWVSNALGTDFQHAQKKIKKRKEEKRNTVTVYAQVFLQSDVLFIVIKACSRLHSVIV